MLLAAAAALANGLTSHVTISEHALAYLPEGELLDILADPALWPYLRNGTQFPDGGYAMGEAYSETSHWEPFQDLYLAWIQEEFAGDWSSDEARQHIAYLMGLGSHGMGDQVFDSLYMQRAYVYDADSDWENVSMDHATDVALAAETGGYPIIDPIIFPDPFIALMAVAGVEVDEEILESGQNLTMVATAAVAAEAASAAHRADWRETFPWAYDHMLDESVHGCPEWEARVVAEYWQVRWARLNGESAASEPLIYSFPQDGGYGHPTDITAVESRVTIVFSRGLVTDLLIPDLFAVHDTDGNPITLIEPWVFYGSSSHVVHLTPAEDWPAETDFVVSIAAGVPFIDGTSSTAAASFTFSTKAPPQEEAPDCGCASAGRAAVWTAGVAFAFAFRRRRAADPRGPPGGAAQATRAGAARRPATTLTTAAATNNAAEA